VEMQVLEVLSGKQFAVPAAQSFGDASVMNSINGAVMVRRLGGHTVLYVPGLAVANGEAAPALIRQDLELLRTRVLSTDRGGSSGWVVDENGEIAAEQAWNDDDKRWTIYFARSGHMERLAGVEQSLDIPALLGWGPSSDTLLVQMTLDDKDVWRL